MEGLGSLGLMGFGVQGFGLGFGLKHFACRD